MAANKNNKTVPASRLGRLARLAKLASGVAGGMLAEGSRQLRAGNQLRPRDMLLTPANAQRVADELSTMRGAAMKLGQILSMDSGEFLPQELADILSRLRSDASAMPEQQLQKVMCDNYGADWEELFYGFSPQPVAAASIGQVHKAFSQDGREIAIKVQYPGVARSIDSDVDNIASVLRISGLVPEAFDIQPLLDEVKLQLREEADYLIEARYLQAFSAALADDDRFVVPALLPELSCEQVLVMTYEAGQPIEVLLEQGQRERDRVVSALLELMFRELFELKMVQTDPNYANYRYRPDSGEIVLLDFGATRRFKAGFVNAYKGLLRAAIAGDDQRLLAAAEKLGYIVDGASEKYRQLLTELFVLVLESVVEDSSYDFGRSDMPARMAELAETMQQYREFWQAPPTDAVFFHRKLGGIMLLAHRMGARVNVHRLVKAWL